MTTVVNITLVQEGDKITVRADSLGQDEEVLALGLQILGHLAYLESHTPELIEVDMPTLCTHQH